MATFSESECSKHECSKGAAHLDSIDFTPEEAARLTEGMCPACDIPADGRADDGFATCSCCGTAWLVGDGVITARVPWRVKVEADA